MKNLLIVSHTPSENTARLTQAVFAGATHVDIGGVQVRLCKPLETGADVVLEADAIILGTTENFGYMSGAMKDFFDRIYYPCLEKTDSLPMALFISGLHPMQSRVCRFLLILQFPHGSSLRPASCLRGYLSSIPPL